MTKSAHRRRIGFQSTNADLWLFASPLRLQALLTEEATARCLKRSGLLSILAIIGVGLHTPTSTFVLF
jgi:hypothetical protein